MRSFVRCELHARTLVRTVVGRGLQRRPPLRVCKGRGWCCEGGIGEVNGTLWFVPVEKGISMMHGKRHDGHPA